MIVNSTDKIDDITSEYILKREALAEEIFNRHDLTQYEKLEIITKARLYTVGAWYYESPECINIEEEELDKYETIYFIYCISNSNIDEIYNWIKENKLIGTVNDW